MKKMLLVLLIFTSCFSRSQATPSANLKAQAEAMETALMGKDYATFVKFINPKLLEASGGSKGMAKKLSDMMGQLQQQHIKIEDIRLSEPSKIIADGKRLQAVIKHTTKITSGGQHVETTSSLLALSSDGGLHWTFLDCGEKDRATIKKLVPDLSPALVIDKKTVSVQKT